MWTMAVISAGYVMEEEASIQYQMNSKVESKEAQDLSINSQAAFVTLVACS
jgi:hypothetical protein